MSDAEAEVAFSARRRQHTERRAASLSAPSLCFAVVKMIIPVRCFTCGKVRSGEDSRGTSTSKKGIASHTLAIDPVSQVIGNKYETYSKMLLEDKEPGCVTARRARWAAGVRTDLLLPLPRAHPGKRWTSWASSATAAAA